MTSLSFKKQDGRKCLIDFWRHEVLQTVKFEFQFTCIYGNNVRQLLFKSTWSSADSIYSINKLIYFITELAATIYLTGLLRYRAFTNILSKHDYLLYLEIGYYSSYLYTYLYLYIYISMWAAYVNKRLYIVYS